MATRRRQVEDDGTNKEGNELARGWRENSKLQQLAHSSTPLQFRARREFQCGLHAKPYSSSCKLPVRANHICFLPVHLFLSLSLYSLSICNNFTLAIRFFSLSLSFPYPFFFLFLSSPFFFLFLTNIVMYGIETNKFIFEASINFEMFDLRDKAPSRQTKLPLACNLIYFFSGP